MAIKIFRINPLVIDTTGAEEPHLVLGKDGAVWERIEDEETHEFVYINVGKWKETRKKKNFKGFYK